MALWRVLPIVCVCVFVAAAPAPSWKDLPLRTRIKAGATARLGDPINIGFEGSRATILAAFQKIGWLEADPLSLKDDARLAVAAVKHASYPKAPVSKLFLFGRMEDFAVEHELGWVAMRDHARFWDTKRQDPHTHLELWIGDASRDVGIEIVRKHGVPVGTTHRINPQLDAERELIVTSMRQAGLVANEVVEQGIGATTNGRNGTNDRFFTDGKVDVLVLTQP